MADYTTYPNGEPIGRAGGANAASMPAFTVFENTLDFSERNLAATDTVSEFLKIPAGSYVLGVAVDVLVADANAATMDVGDATDPNGYVAAVAVNATGKTAGAGAYLDNVGAYVTPQYYTADTWLQLTIAAAGVSTGKVRVAALVANAG